jgi:hypothetical protein
VTLWPVRGQRQGWLLAISDTSQPGKEVFLWMNLAILEMEELSSVLSVYC